MKYIEVNLNDICRPKQWKTISIKVLAQEGYPVYGANGKIGYYSEYNHKTPTILITCRGATCGSINVSESYSYINGNAMALDNLDTKRTNLSYLRYYLEYRKFNDVISGSAQPQITREGLEKVKISLPPLKKQRQIATILDKADAMRKKRKETLRLMDDYLRSLFLDMFGDPVKNPKKWQILTMADIVQETQYGTSKKANNTGNGFPVLRMNNITYDGYLDLTNIKHCEITKKEFDRFTVKRGDILFNRTNSPELVGKTAVWDKDEVFAFAGYLIRVRFDENRILPHYVSGYLNSSYGKQLIFIRAKPSINMSNLSASTFRKLPIPIPSVYLQQKFSDIVQKVEKQKDALWASEVELDNLFNVLAQRAFRGEL